MLNEIRLKYLKTSQKGLKVEKAEQIQGVPKKSSALALLQQQANALFYWDTLQLIGNMAKKKYQISDKPDI